MATTSKLSPPRKLGGTELVVLTAMLMALHALAIDGMLPALDEIASDFDMLDANKRQYIVRPVPALHRGRAH